MTNEKVKELMVEVIGVDTFPPVIENGVEWFTDSTMQTFAERVVNECIAAVNVGDANTNAQVADQIRTHFGITV